MSKNIGVLALVAVILILSPSISLAQGEETLTVTRTIYPYLEITVIAPKEVNASYGTTITVTVKARAIKNVYIETLSVFFFYYPSVGPDYYASCYKYVPLVSDTNITAGWTTEASRTFEVYGEGPIMAEIHFTGGKNGWWYPVGETWGVSRYEYDNYAIDFPITQVHSWQYKQYYEVSDSYMKLQDEYYSLLSEYNSLNSSYQSLNSSYYNLQDSYNSLFSDYSSLSSKYHDLKSNYNSLSSDYTSLKYNYDNLKSSYNSLKTDHTKLQSSYNNLNSAYASLKSKYDDLNSKYLYLQSDYNSLTTKYQQHVLILILISIVLAILSVILAVRLRTIKK